MPADEHLESSHFTKPFPALPHPDVEMEVMDLQKTMRAHLEAAWEAREILGALIDRLNDFTPTRVREHPLTSNRVVRALAIPDSEVSGREPNNSGQIIEIVETASGSPVGSDTCITLEFKRLRLARGLIAEPLRSKSVEVDLCSATSLPP
jgi:hypothetical protein